MGQAPDLGSRKLAASGYASEHMGRDGGEALQLVKNASKQQKLTAAISGVVAIVDFLLISVVGHSVGSVFELTLAVAFYWSLLVALAAATFLLAWALGKLWCAGTGQRYLPMIATISVWAMAMFFLAYAMLLGAGERVSGVWSGVAFLGFMGGAVSAVVFGTTSLVSFLRRTS